ncbi:MAG: (Fe-S)-binding protein [Chloroflexi bacterium]|nr:(Fe-S)-binding protein [Chloroflexota bacterium]
MQQTHPSAGFTIPDPPSDDALSQCVRCGLCLPHCPTFRELHVETASPRGRLHLMRALGEGRVDVTDTFVSFMNQCLECRACEANCPSGVQFGSLMEATRAEIRARRPLPLRARLLGWLVFGQVFPKPGAMAAFASLLRLYQRLGIQALVRGSGALRLLPGRLDEAESLLPRISSRFFEPKGRVPARGTVKKQAAFFAGCIMRVAFAETNRATVRLLSRAGCDVDLPEEQTCCGALHAHAGERERAKDLARRNIAAFERSGAEWIVVNAAGCGAMLKEYGELLANDVVWAERAHAFSARVRDLSEALADLPLPTPARPFPVTVTYQDACHLLHAQRIRQQPREVLQRVPGLTLVEMKDGDRCCGSAGIYNITQPEMAERLGEQKVENVEATRAEIVVSGNPGCLIQMRAGLERHGATTKAVHIADFLDAAYRER